LGLLAVPAGGHDASRRFPSGASVARDRGSQRSTGRAENLSSTAAMSLTPEGGFGMPDQESTPSSQAESRESGTVDELTTRLDPVALAEDARDLAAALIADSPDPTYKARVEKAMEETRSRLAEQGHSSIADRLKL
jgi:hypothetical protein